MSPRFDDTDDLPLRSRHATEDDYAAAPTSRRSMSADDAAPIDREFTLNTGVVLALFFFLVLLCAVFFGFGFSMGKKSGLATAEAAIPAATPSENQPATATLNHAKPAPGTAGGDSVPAYVSTGGSPGGTTDSSPRPAPVKPAAALPAPPAEAAGATPRPAPVVRTTPAPTPAVPAQQTPMPATPSAGTGSTYVQVAAVSHQEDADVLLSALRRRGYTVLTRTDLGDKLIHVQIGPYGNRKDAEAMRQKLIGDGYNAFLK